MDSKIIIKFFGTLSLFCLINIALSWLYIVPVANAFRDDDSRILKWSPTWLSSDPERYSSRFINRLNMNHGTYYKRFREDEPTPYKWIPWYFSRSNWGSKRTIPVAWDGGDSYQNVGSPEWFRDDELIN